MSNNNFKTFSLKTFSLFLITLVCTLVFSASCDDKTKFSLDNKIFIPPTSKGAFKIYVNTILKQNKGILTIIKNTRNSNQLFNTLKEIDINLEKDVNSITGFIDENSNDVTLEVNLIKYNKEKIVNTLKAKSKNITIKNHAGYETITNNKTSLAFIDSNKILLSNKTLTDYLNIIKKGGYIEAQKTNNALYNSIEQVNNNNLIWGVLNIQNSALALNKKDPTQAIIDDYLKNITYILFGASKKNDEKENNEKENNEKENKNKLFLIAKSKDEASSNALYSNINQTLSLFKNIIPPQNTIEGKVLHSVVLSKEEQKEVTLSLEISEADLVKLIDKQAKTLK